MNYQTKRGVVILGFFILALIFAIPIVLIWNVIAAYLPIGTISLWNGIILVIVITMFYDAEEIFEFSNNSMQLLRKREKEDYDKNNNPS